jgi:tetratricopeptide (TPR) repeat protein
MGRLKLLLNPDLVPPWKWYSHLKFKDMTNILRQKLYITAILLWLATISFSCTSQTENSIQKGNTLYAAGDWAGAIKEYDAAINSDKPDKEAYYKRGLALRNNGDLAAAIKDFNKSISILPDFSEALAARALTYALQNDISPAMEDMDKAIMMNNDNARTLENNMVDAYLRLGVAFRDHGKSIYAQAFLGKVIRIKHEWAPGYIERSKIYTGSKGYDLAIVDLNKAIKYDDASFEAYLLRSENYMNLEKYDLALADADKAVSLDSKSADAFLIRGLVYYKSGNYGKALPDLNTSVDLDQSKYSARYYRGLVYMAKNMKTEALADFKAVMSMKDVDPEVLGKSQSYIADLSAK